MGAQDEFNRQWIIDNGIPIVESYAGNITLRALHYRLVARGMTNSQRHYKRVIQAMTQARWDGLLSFDAFKDHERETMGVTEYEQTTVERRLSTARWGLEHYAKTYDKNRWENQPKYVEVFIEKKALQGVFERPCERKAVALNPCKGYPSLTFLADAAERFKEASDEGKEVIILYFGDYDPSGEDIPRSIQENLSKMGANVEVERIALMEHQVIEWELPPAPAKSGDSRTANWDGLGQVELDAVEPRDLVVLVNDAIDKHFDEELYAELMEQEREERIEFRERIKHFVNNELYGDEED